VRAEFLQAKHSFGGEKSIAEVRSIRPLPGSRENLTDLAGLGAAFSDMVPSRGAACCTPKAMRAPLRLSICCAISLALTGPVRAQEQQHFPMRAPAVDIVRDNLSRAAATADEILELLNKDPGLMVEFKQALAKDAGLSGQTLIEAGLSEAAIVERLRTELHSRTLATALLRRYGYLVPRINPDSDLAAEHRLMLRERAQELERASERRGLAEDQPRTERISECRARVRILGCPRITGAATTIAAPEWQALLSSNTLRGRFCERRTEKFQTICRWMRLLMTAN
jgi:hypothetical protein